MKHIPQDLAPVLTDIGWRIPRYKDLPSERFYATRAAALAEVQNIVDDELVSRDERRHGA